jgi:hypothetical protein
MPQVLFLAMKSGHDHGAHTLHIQTVSPYIWMMCVLWLLSRMMSLSSFSHLTLLSPHVLVLLPAVVQNSSRQTVSLLPGSSSPNAENHDQDTFSHSVLNP